ncbi:ATP-binding protein [Nocardiopsis sp. NRRL B-16309]|uniref:ATP-binding protein n=1 Tax=Nocardiopsis sp. NRRL B-16309 TaxID=1519494 RepID=UPI001E416681|nr:ATP-binding protein [Nocardiopsis sp. NRRL B-16309]
MCGTPTKSGLVLGSDLRQVGAARRWAAGATRSVPSLSRPVALVTSELVTNALVHSASGLPGGTVRVELEHKPLHLVLSVTDNGPRPDQPLTFPTIPRLDPTRPGGNGLRLVEDAALYWEWDGCAGGPTTVLAFFERATLL